MTTMIMRIELPPHGRLETSGNGSDPSAADMADEDARRTAFVDGLGPTFDAVLARPLHRSGNVSRIQLLGTPIWSQMNHYLLLVEVDIGDPRLDLDTIAPRGSVVEVIGEYRPLRSWPDETPARSVRPSHTRPATRGFDTLEERTMTAPTTSPTTPGTSVMPLPPPHGPWDYPWDYWPRNWPPYHYPWPGGPGNWGIDPTTPPPATNGTRFPDGRGPLTPDGFGEGTSNGMSTAVEPVPEGTVITEADKATFRRVREILAEVRKGLGSTDKDEVAQTKQRLNVVVGYVGGFLDGKGAVLAGGSPGLAGLFPAPERSPEEHLDEIDMMLERLSSTETRFPSLYEMIFGDRDVNFDFKLDPPWKWFG